MLASVLGSALNAQVVKKVAGDDVWVELKPEHGFAVGDAVFFKTTDSRTRATGKVDEISEDKTKMMVRVKSGVASVGLKVEKGFLGVLNMNPKVPAPKVEEGQQQ